MTGPAGDSPLARLRKAHAAKQEERKPRFADLATFGDDTLVARLRTVDVDSARGAMRAMAAIVSADAVQVTAEDYADLIARATDSLHVRDINGTLDAILGEDGQPVRFDASYGRALGDETIVTPIQAVFEVFTEREEGQPPAVNASQLIAAASSVAVALNQEREAAREEAAAVVGEASTLRS